MPIPVTCANCDSELPVPDELAGKAVRCGGCGHPVTVPAAGAAPPPLAVARRVATPIREPLERPRRRPVRREPERVALTPAGTACLAVLGVAGLLGFGTVFYALLSGLRLNDSPAPTAARPADPQPAPVRAAPAPMFGMAMVQPAPPPRFEPALPRFDAPAEPIPGRPAPPFGGEAVPPPFRPNSNALVRKYTGRLTAAASSEYQQWPVGKLIDGEALTSWFALEQHNHAPRAVGPWVEVRFPESVSVRRVTVLGNREPQWPNGYTVTRGRFDLLGDDGRVLATAPFDGQGPKRDFEFEPKPGQAVDGVRAVRFTVTAAENMQGPALAEVEIE